MNRRPLTIEFTGPPNSGKTTLIHGICNELTKQGFNVQVMQEDAELVPKEIPKKTWIRNAWITFGQLQSLLEIPYSNADIILLDRGYCDALFWANFLQIQDVCSLEQSQSLLRVLNEMNMNFNLLPDYLFIIDVSVEESLKRRYAMGGKIVLSNPEFISLYIQELEKFYKGITCPKLRFDSTNVNAENSKFFVLSEILKLLK